MFWVWSIGSDPDAVRADASGQLEAVIGVHLVLHLVHAGQLHCQDSDFRDHEQKFGLEQERTALAGNFKVRCQLILMIRLIVISYHLSFTDYNRLLLQNYLKLRFVQYYDNIILPLAIAHLYGTYQNLIGSNRKYNTLNRLAEQCYVAKVIERAETKLMMYIQ